MKEVVLERFGKKVVNSDQPISLVEDYLDNVVCINLDRAEERLSTLTEKLEKQHISWRRFSAYDTSCLEPVSVASSGDPAVFVDPMTNKEYKSGWNQSGHLGAARSHREVIKYAKYNKLSSITIFEDDLEFFGDLKATFTSHFKYVPDDWDIIFLGGGIRYRARPVFVNRYVVKATRTWGMLAYIARDTIYDDLLKAFSDQGITDHEGLTFSLDWSLQKMQRQKNIYALYPPMVHHDCNKYSFCSGRTLGNVDDNIYLHFDREKDGGLRKRSI